MARNYNNPIVHSGVVTATTYPKYAAVYSSATGDAYWATTQTTYAGSFGSDWTRDFFWKPTIGVKSKGKPRTKVIQFGDGYSQRSEDGINTQMLSLDLTFDKRSDAEAYGLLHFLHEMGGWNKFGFDPPAPYNQNTGLNFICREWDHSKNFKNNNTITATFEQVPEV